MSIDLTELNELASQLKQLTDSTVVKLEDLIELVKANNVAVFETFFNEPDQRYQARRMFYVLEQDGSRKKTTPRIVYQDEVKFVCVSRSGYNDYSNEYYSAAWVVGISEAQCWIHRLQYSYNLDNPAYVWTDDYIHSKMGFHADVTTDDDAPMERLKVMRVQGDLTIELHRTFEEYTKNARESVENEIMREFDKQITNQLWDAAELQEKADKIKEDCDKDIEVLKIVVDKKYRNKKEREKISEIRVKHGMIEKTRVVWRLIAKLEDKKEHALGNLVYQTRHSEHFKQKRALEVGKLLDEWKIEQFWKKNELWIQQLNIRMGNHLVIVSSGVHERRGIDEFVVPEPTTAYFLHDEHMNTKLSLKPGVYRLGMLTRHRQDTR